MPIRSVNRAVSSVNLPELTGGLTIAQSQDNECQVFENVDIVRNQWAASRSGTTIAHEPNALGSSPVAGIANCGIGDGSLYIVVAKKGTTYYYHKPQAGWAPGQRVSFSSFLVPYDCGGDAVNFEAVPIKKGLF